MGSCATTTKLHVAAWHPHFGEEPPISGVRGSGTVFLANCNLRCVYCQNWDISQLPRNFLHHTMGPSELAEAMLDLQALGCHNINWVSPTHQLPQLVEALLEAAERGLSIPIVYNTNAYDSVEALALLEGVVDIYMPDLKYADPEAGSRYSRVPDYPQAARAALVEMFRQVGEEWVTDAAGVLRRGLLVRLLVLPNGLAGVEESLAWMAQHLSPRVTVSLLSQYRPCHWVERGRFPELARRITLAEYQRALAALDRHNRSEHTYVQPFFAF
ncbi:MAG: radical SAM protein [Thermoanaerobaculum sp.]|nr:radical SAM protein [Thermoanaerobaculum sp.]MCX7896070.1 radical SAM protein [Thermoanaerobaculum sp.]MDW7967990.1 radical SAM protein [Thermoanaerobaculum sp.]